MENKKNEKWKIECCHARTLSFSILLIYFINYSRLKGRQTYMTHRRRIWRWRRRWKI